MEKLLKLINEYEDSRWKTIDDWLTEEERESWVVVEEQPLRKEYKWHLRHCNANTVAYEKNTFDAYALSKIYGFIWWLVANDYLVDHEATYSPLDWKNITIWDYCIPTINQSLTDSLYSYIATQNNPLVFITNILK